MDKVYALIHRVDFEDCAYIVGVFESREDAILCIKKEYPKYKINELNREPSWEGNGVYLEITEEKFYGTNR